MNKKTLLFTTLLFGLGLTVTNAQQSANSSGGKASGSGGTATYSVGQVVYTTATGSNGSVVQGVQQPFEISVVLGLEEAENISLNLMAYPNPATDRLTLKVDNYDGANLSFQLFDLTGKLLHNAKVKSNETVINMQDYQFGVYFLKVFNTNKEIKTFKILKN